jgi:hypothetical protein
MQRLAIEMHCTRTHKFFLSISIRVTIVYRSVKTQQDQQFQTDLHSLERWATKWGTCFNATKCYIMSIHRSRNPLTTHYILNNHILEHVQENPYLGVIISENLKWSTYINKICNKANSTLGFIRRNLKHCNRKFKETAYISLVLFDYLCTVWDPHLQKEIDRIENVQRRAARFIYSDYKRTGTAVVSPQWWKNLTELTSSIIQIQRYGS